MLILHQRILADSPPPSTFQKRLLSLDRLFAFPLWNILGDRAEIQGTKRRAGIQPIQLMGWKPSKVICLKRSCEVSVCDNDMYFKVLL